MVVASKTAMKAAVAGATKGGADKKSSSIKVSGSPSLSTHIHLATPAPAGDIGLSSIKAVAIAPPPSTHFDKVDWSAVGGPATGSSFNMMHGAW
eukprot:TRINITY_DN24597_c0_g1_i1.p1 TRINITY_DN24597_c0_g1~~TRINITY_DN24597_c0_g1_i1.p1  ORF type:complete len:108 (+),score=28.94 TRINITY_DN24597_c0_g1_i1:45-326(+)